MVNGNANNGAEMDLMSMDDMLTTGAPRTSGPSLPMPSAARARSLGVSAMKRSLRTRANVTNKYVITPENADLHV